MTADAQIDHDDDLDAWVLNLSLLVDVRRLSDPLYGVEVLAEASAAIAQRLAAAGSLPIAGQEVAAARAFLAEEHGTTVSAIASGARHRAPTRARHELAWMAVELGELSLVAVGRLLGRDHTTIMYARDRIALEVAKDRALRKRLEGTWAEAVAVATMTAAGAAGDAYAEARKVVVG